VPVNILEERDTRGSEETQFIGIIVLHECFCLQVGVDWRGTVSMGHPPYSDRILILFEHIAKEAVLLVLPAYGHLKVPLMEL
jgi:hypothetical protein